MIWLLSAGSKRGGGAQHHGWNLLRPAEPSRRKLKMSRPNKRQAAIGWHLGQLQRYFCTGGCCCSWPIRWPDGASHLSTVGGMPWVCTERMQPLMPCCHSVSQALPLMGCHASCLRPLTGRLLLHLTQVVEEGLPQVGGSIPAASNVFANVVSLCLMRHHT